MADPFREQRFSPAEVRRIVRRAAQLADSDAEARNTEKSLSRTELESLFEQLGLPASSVARALGGDIAPEPASQADRGGFVGAPTRIVFEVEVDGEPSDEDLEDLVAEIRAETHASGIFEKIGRTFSWRLDAIPGRSRELTVHARSRKGRTRVVVEELLSRQAVGLFVGLGVGGGVGPTAAYIAAIVAWGPIAALIPIAWIAFMLLLARTFFGQLHRRRERDLRRLFDRVVRASAAWCEHPVRARVAAAAPSRTDDAEEEEREVEEQRRAVKS